MTVQANCETAFPSEMCVRPHLAPSDTTQSGMNVQEVRVRVTAGSC